MKTDVSLKHILARGQAKKSFIRIIILSPIPSLFQSSFIQHISFLIRYCYIMSVDLSVIL